MVDHARLELGQRVGVLEPVRQPLRSGPRGTARERLRAPPRASYGSRTHRPAGQRSIVRCEELLRGVKLERRARAARATTWSCGSSRRPGRRSCRATPTRSTPRTSAQISASTSSGACAARRRPPASRAPARRRQGAAVDLAVGGQRQVQQHERRRDHVVGQPLAELRAQPVRRRRRGAVGHHVGDQPRSRRPSSRATTTASRTPGWRGERGLDLAQLDPEAADLDLVVEPAQVLERAVRQARAPGRRCGTSALARLARTGRGRTARRSGPGRPQVAAGQADAADVQLARRRRSGPARRPRSST